MNHTENLRIESKKKSQFSLFIIALILTGFNLRIALTSLPPLVGDIERWTGLGAIGAGLLTTLPVLAMGIVAPIVPGLTNRFGRENTIIWSLGMLTLGIGGRFWGDSLTVLYFSTTVAGCGIAVTGAVLPGLIREHFASRAGMMTGLYAGAMALGATIAAGAAVPLRDTFDSWEKSLSVWALPAFVAFLFWIPLSRANKKHQGQQSRISLPWRHPVAWLITGYVTIQSLLFFSQMAWLAPLYVANHFSEKEAGFLFSIYSIAGLVATVLIPTLSDRWKDKRPIMIGSVCCALTGLSLLTFIPATLSWFTVIILGFGQTASFSLGLVLLVAFAPQPRIAGQLTAMAFLVAYIVAAIGPIALGALQEITNGYSVPFTLLLIINAVSLIFAFQLKPGLRVDENQ
ncbi:MFS transporter, CP family, cyanate transporter [Seinonella peptonophila]|uniref:MFS transporter, CP family, cyanate transporter n=1 Tax=Seinonella peptonophila TaxID=112248 RepID=A0A1M4TZ65_9BACL|nr:MFS transporter [Seinonella peptonophila]SHE49634.1 MFS transporter, CP family, cyanate transporter [Seinonella peptonophila]